MNFKKFDYNRKSLIYKFFLMIDIKILRNNPEIVEKTLVNKGIKGVDLAKVIELDKERIRLQQELDELRAKRNEISSKMGK